MNFLAPLMLVLLAGCVAYDPARMPMRPVPSPSPICDRVEPPRGCGVSVETQTP